MDGQPKAPRQLLGQGHRDFIHSLRFEGMDPDQNHGSPAQHHGERLHSPITDRIGDQGLRRQGITTFAGRYCGWPLTAGSGACSTTSGNRTGDAVGSS
jgi:hypothetical protein